MTMERLGTTLLGLLLAAAPLASAQTLYKLIDKNGKVTYSETEPKEFDGRVIRIDIDPKANIATLPKPPAEPAAPLKAGPEAPVGVKVRTPADTARENLEKARKALEEARDNPSDADFRYLGNVGGGTRRVPTDEYLARVSALEQALKRAEGEARKYEAAK
jgi:hypothetical protein